MAFSGMGRKIDDKEKGDGKDRGDGPQIGSNLERMAAELFGNDSSDDSDAGEHSTGSLTPTREGNSDRDKYQSDEFEDSQEKGEDEGEEETATASTGVEVEASNKRLLNLFKELNGKKTPTKKEPEKEKEQQPKEAPRPEAFYALQAGDKIKDADHAAAALLYSMAIRRKPEEPRYFCNRSNCYITLKKYEAALEDANEAIRLDAYRPKPYFMKSKALVGLEKFEEAEELLVSCPTDLDEGDLAEELVKIKEAALRQLGCNSFDAFNYASSCASVEAAVNMVLKVGTGPKTRPMSSTQGSIESGPINSRAAIPFKRDRYPTNDQTKRPVTGLSSRPLPHKVNKPKYILRDEPRSETSVYSSHNNNLWKNKGKKWEEEEFRRENNNVRPENVYGFTGLWIGNVYPKCKEEKLREVFSKYGKITQTQMIPETNCAFVSFDNPESPRDAIRELYDQKVWGISNRQMELRLRFAPGLGQDRSIMKRVNASANRKPTDECYFWRTTGCEGRCQSRHVDICKAIDRQPWMKKKEGSRDEEPY